MIYNRKYVHRRFHVLVTDPNADLFFGMMFRRLPSADRDYTKSVHRLDVPPSVDRDYKK
uniref:Uncharacterized protein n=1 Tax=Helianthus annuus TaxID=4232 RepID=A0A251UYD2_HELAN